jgi:Peroxin-3
MCWNHHGVKQTVARLLTLNAHIVPPLPTEHEFHVLSLNLSSPLTITVYLTSCSTMSETTFINDGKDWPPPLALLEAYILQVVIFWRGWRKFESRLFRRRRLVKSRSRTRLLWILVLFHLRTYLTTIDNSLRRRFQQNQQDCTYTVLALVPTLGDRILEQMDVEGVTFTLQMQSKAAKSRTEGSAASDMNTSSISLNTDQPSIASSIELSPGRQDIAVHSPSSRHGGSAQSWIDQFTEQSSSASSVGPSAHDIPRDRGSPASSSGAHLSDSVTSASVSLVSGSDGVVRISAHDTSCRLSKDIL